MGKEISGMKIITDSDWSSIDMPERSNMMPTAALMISGPPIEPLTRIMTYHSDEWEKFINEWVTSLSQQYISVQRFTGAGDKGVDVAAFTSTDQLLGDWHNYQCKHYNKPLGPTDAYLEIGKCLWYSFRQDFAPPKAYFFVAPRGVSTKLGLILGNKVKLREGLYAAWQKSIGPSITSTQVVDLSGDFKNFVEGFDFSIFKVAPPLVVIEQHRKTHYFIQRFGGGLPARPKPSGAPEDIASTEIVYTKKLLAAYSDHSGKDIKKPADLIGQKKLQGHFNRSREAFYHSEALRIFVRDKTEPGTFESLQDEVFHGIADTCDAVHSDGYAKVIAATERAQTLKLGAHSLSASTFPRDLVGICHQLANDDRLDWNCDD